MNKDFEKYAVLDHKVNSNGLQKYVNRLQVVPPSIIEERKLNVTATDIFSRLMMDRIIFLGTTIDDDIANIIQAQLLYLSSLDPNEDISIYLNTPGGYVSSGLAIYDTIQMVTPDVKTVCTGMSASMGAVLLCSGTKGKRSILPHARVMIHQPMGGAFGQASDILIEAQEIEKTRRELLTIISNHTGQPYKKVFKDADRDYWMTADEALKYGMVDSVLNKVK